MASPSLLPNGDLKRCAWLTGCQAALHSHHHVTSHTCCPPSHPATCHCISSLAPGSGPQVPQLVECSVLPPRVACSRYCCAPPFCCGFCVLGSRRGAPSPPSGCSLLVLLLCLAALRCAACLLQRLRAGPPLLATPPSAAPVRPSARRRSARVSPLSPSSHGKLDAAASPTATLHT
jgi:hypothetical protein